jgi:hypothetical protein
LGRKTFVYLTEEERTLIDQAAATEQAGAIDQLLVPCVFSHLLLNNAERQSTRVS